MIDSNLVVDSLIKKLNSKEKEISYMMLSSTILSVILKQEILDEQKFQLLILKGDREIRESLAFNPNLSFSQWIMLCNDESESVRKAARCNEKHLEYESNLETKGEVKNVS